MKRIIAIAVLAAAAALLCSSASAKKKSGTSDKESFHYDVEYVKSAGTGMSVVRVVSFSTIKMNDDFLSRRNAVHAVIFKGYSGSGATQPALAKDPDTEYNNKDFFDKFFAKDGDYSRFVTGVSDYEAIKFGKQHKYSANVTVNVAALRKYLEQHGIIRSLSSGF